MITAQGQTLTMREWAEITGINLHTLQYRRYCGWEDEDIVSTPIAQRGPRQVALITCGGVTRTASEWSSELGIPVQTIYSRLRAGITEQDALQPLYHPRTTAHLITADGETHTVTEWARIRGVTPKAIWQRLRKGLSPEEAVTLPKGARLRP